MKFNPNNWNIQDIIKARVDLEAEVEHANDPRPPLKSYAQKKVSNNSVGWYNFVRTTLNELRP